MKERTKKIFCVECNQEVDAVLKTGKDIYKHREDLYYLFFWQCPKCSNYVGTHKNSFRKHKPLGVIPNEALKKIRMKTHFYIDRIWKKRLMHRNKVYDFISEKLGYRYHTGTTKSIDECNKAINISIKLYDDVIRNKENGK